mmetsp:Transcript_31449/g.89275  ORF Transcript_31449/g.89275 Transcript_31449/m.89275 type:complete len:207 (+) Transcript_31449:3490-4110(+)
MCPNSRQSVSLSGGCADFRASTSISSRRSVALTSEGFDTCCRHSNNTWKYSIKGLGKLLASSRRAAAACMSHAVAETSSPPLSFITVRRALSAEQNICKSAWAMACRTCADDRLRMVEEMSSAMPLYPTMTSRISGRTLVILLSSFRDSMITSCSSIVTPAPASGPSAEGCPQRRMAPNKWRTMRSNDSLSRVASLAAPEEDVGGS